MSREIINPAVTFVSLVDKPANKRPFLITKAEQQPAMSATAAEYMAKFSRENAEKIAQRMITNRKQSPHIFKAADRPFELYEVRIAANELNIAPIASFKGIL